MSISSAIKKKKKEKEFPVKEFNKAKGKAAKYRSQDTRKKERITTKKRDRVACVHGAKVQSLVSDESTSCQPECN